MVPYLGMTCVYNESSVLRYAGQVVKVLSNDHVDVAYHAKNVVGNWTLHYASNVLFVGVGGGSYPFVTSA